ncbi:MULTISPECIES: DUF559 domain-containing protein [Methylobacterium]|uniref:DUF559 domain-containing protein n=1 Tax=Methylobacterium TaxID=407 RepID=UPI00338EF197
MRAASPERAPPRRQRPGSRIEVGQRPRHGLSARRLAGFTSIRRASIGRCVATFSGRDTRGTVEPEGGRHADGRPDRGGDARPTAQGHRVRRFRNVEIARRRAGVLDAAPAAPPSSRRAQGEARGGPAVASLSTPVGRGEIPR